ncbi:E1-E2 ATPase-domain-containing protein, partial [Ochromonadaceae sp. CCMP2298]
GASDGAEILYTFSGLGGGAGVERLIDARLLHRRGGVRLFVGDTVPADGVLLRGWVGVDEGAVTGEAAAVTKRGRDEVFAGSRVVQAGLGGAAMRVTGCGGDSTLGGITAAVQRAKASRRRVPDLSDRIAGLYVPLIAALSLLTLLTWPTLHALGWVSSASLGGSALIYALFSFLSLWAGATPCAYCLAPPAVALVGVGVGARLGLLLRPDALQRAAQISAVAFDKTGTLTRGARQVSDYLYCAGREADTADTVADTGTGTGTGTGAGAGTGRDTNTDTEADTLAGAGVSGNLGTSGGGFDSFVPLGPLGGLGSSEHNYDDWGYSLGKPLHI